MLNQCLTWGVSVLQIKLLKWQKFEMFYLIMWLNVKTHFTPWQYDWNINHTLLRDPVYEFLKIYKRNVKVLRVKEHPSKCGNNSSFHINCFKHYNKVNDISEYINVDIGIINTNKLNAVMLTYKQNCIHIKKIAPFLEPNWSLVKHF